MNINNYWTKDQTRKEAITKTQIPNVGNFNVFATYYNLMDKQGLSLPLNFENDLAVDKVYRKNNFEYFVLKYNDWKELYILPNEKITELAERVISKINNCTTETQVMNLMIAEMQKHNPMNPTSSQFILFKTEDEKISVDVRFENETVWLTQDQMVMLFDKANQH